jgi:hypothetical protein
LRALPFANKKYLFFVYEMSKKAVIKAIAAKTSEITAELAKEFGPYIQAILGSVVEYVAKKTGEEVEKLATTLVENPEAVFDKLEDIYKSGKKKKEAKQFSADKPKPAKNTYFVLDEDAENFMRCENKTPMGAAKKGANKMRRLGMKSDLVLLYCKNNDKFYAYRIKGYKMNDFTNRYHFGTFRFLYQIHQKV